MGVAPAYGCKFDVLLVEDNPGDVRLTQEALAECKIPFRLHIARDGFKALQFLRRESGFEDVQRPDLVLLDWNLPKMHGQEVLQSIKADKALRAIPVVVLTTSQAERDIEAAYSLHANCFITKPANITQYFAMISALEQFWMHTATLPSK